MGGEIKGKRHYASARRQAQAGETRRSILEAASRLFVERGYSGSTMEAIAREAGVAVETVYATFKNKRSILVQLMDVAVVGDEEPVPLLEREEVRAVHRMADQQEQVRVFSARIRNIMERAGPIFQVMRAAAPVEPEIESLLREYLRKRRSGMHHFVSALEGAGALRNGLSSEDATDTLLTLTSAEVHGLLTRDLGWSPDRYEQWLSGTIRDVLLRAKR